MIRNRTRKIKQRLISRILITLLGIALILMGSSWIILGVVGKSAPAVITSIRREGGERTDGKPGRYTYNIGYAFTLPDGKEINGFSKKIGDSVYLKPDGTSVVQVRYLPSLPYINAMDKDTGFGAGQFTLILAGTALIFLINTKNRGGNT